MAKKKEEEKKKSSDKKRDSKDKSKKKEKAKEEKKKKVIKKKIEESESHVSKQEDEFDEFKELLLPGQKHPTPPLGDGTRAFYETLYNENSNSKMAEKWLFEHGVFD